MQTHQTSTRKIFRYIFWNHKLTCQMDIRLRSRDPDSASGGARTHQSLSSTAHAPLLCHKSSEKKSVEPPSLSLVPTFRVLFPFSLPSVTTQTFKSGLKICPSKKNLLARDALPLTADFLAVAYRLFLKVCVCFQLNCQFVCSPANTWH